MTDLAAFRLRVRSAGIAVQRSMNLTGDSKAYLTYDFRRSSLEAAVASFGPTGLSLPTLQHELYVRLYPKLLAGLSLGEAVKQTKTEMLAAYPAEREFLNGWVLLGDPDVRLPR